MNSDCWEHGRENGETADSAFLTLRSLVPVAERRITPNRLSTLRVIVQTKKSFVLVLLVALHM